MGFGMFLLKAEEKINRSIIVYFIIFGILAIITIILCGFFGICLLAIGLMCTFCNTLCITNSADIV